jgi:hypothetical protein
LELLTPSLTRTAPLPPACSTAPPPLARTARRKEHRERTWQHGWDLIAHGDGRDEIKGGAQREELVVGDPHDGARQTKPTSRTGTGPLTLPHHAHLLDCAPTVAEDYLLPHLSVSPRFDAEVAWLGVVGIGYDFGLSVGVLYIVKGNR